MSAALTGMTQLTADPLGVTRRSLHAVAELVMAGPQYRTGGTIRLIVTARGFGTLTAPDLRIDGVDLVAGRDRVAVTGRTCGELAEAVGVLVGRPEDLYHDGSGVRPDEPLSLDADAAGWIYHCWQAGAAALSQLDPALQPILWPEHFDVGILSDGVAYGVSPGDGYLSEPYAYVNPGPARSGEYWNAPFGAAVPMRQLDDGNATEVLDYFRRGRVEAARTR